MCRPHPPHPLPPPPPFPSNSPTLPHPLLLLLLLLHPMSSPPPQPPRRRLAPPIWSHDETLSLIHSYRSKYLSLRRPNLRAADWDDVASDLSLRRSSPSLLPSKTPIQCRHKLEKLRKRFRSDRRRSLDQHPQSPPSSSWPFFPLMESLDRPPVPNAELLPFVIPKAVRSKPAAAEEAMRMVGDGFMRLERVKLDMVRETEKMRMEMELKRTKMILDSQRRVVDAFVKGVGGGGVRRKKGKVSTDSRSFR